jgi:hypothetical protein
MEEHLGDLVTELAPQWERHASPDAASGDRGRQADAGPKCHGGFGAARTRTAGAASRRSRASVSVGSGSLRSMRGHLQTGNVVILKSVAPERIRQNLDVFGFELSDDAIAAHAPFDTGRRTGPGPDGLN